MIYLRNGKEYDYDHSQDEFLEKLYSTSLGRTFLSLMIKPMISKIGGMYMNSFFSKYSIQSFIDKNHIDMSQYEEKKYISYNDFFTRKIKNGMREFPTDTNLLCAPCDSKLSYYKIDDETKLTIKNTVYDLKDLLMSQPLADEYKNGICLVFRLTVDDYHRYHFIDDGQVVRNQFIQGVFHTVNPIANDYYPIYKTNTREYTVLDTRHFGQVIQMEVGALMVGKISNHSLTSFSRFDEKGYFEFGGSTVVLLLKENVVDIDDDIIQYSSHNDEVKVLLGEVIGRKK